MIRRASEGDEKAFEALVNAHYEMIYAIAFKWVRNRADAEDIAQNACIKLARAIHTFKNEALFTTWLYRIVINCAKDYQRQAGRIRAYESDDASDGQPAANDSPEKHLYAKDMLDSVYALPDKERDAILLVFGEEMTHGAAAQILGVSEVTVSWRIHNARKRLRKKMEAL